MNEEALQELLRQLDWWKEQNFRSCMEKGELSYRAEAAEAELQRKEKYYDHMVDALAATDSAELAETKKKLEAAKARCATLERTVKGYQDELIPGYRELTEVAGRETGDGENYKADWVNAEDDLPKYGQQVLVWCRSKMYKPHISLCTFLGVTNGPSGPKPTWSRKRKKVTYWAPLPPKPSQGEEE